MDVRIVAGFLALLALSDGPSLAGMIGDAPDAILCSASAVGTRPGGTVVLYLDGQTDDGTLFYKSLGPSPIQVVVGSDGVVDAGNIKSCDGKTLQQLRDDDSAFDLG